MVSGAIVRQRHAAAVGAEAADAAVRKVGHRLEAADEARQDERAVEQQGEAERGTQLRLQ